MVDRYSCKIYVNGLVFVYTFSLNSFFLKLKITFMLIFKCSLVAVFLLTAYFTSKPFVGDVTDKEYVKMQKVKEIVKTDSSASTLSQTRVTVYKFNEDGLLIEKKEEGKETLLTRFIYDKNGNLTESATLRPDGSIYSIEKMSYDNKNRLSESEIRLIAEKMTIKDNIEWVDERTRHTTRVRNGETMRFLSVFDEQNRIVDQTFDNGSGNNWIYDGAALIMKKDKANGPGSGNIERYEYDNNQRISLIEKVDNRRTFNYDGRGRLISTVTKDDNERTLAFERYEYAPSTN